MNTSNVEKNWTELKSKIKAKWTKFNDLEIESLKDNLDQITAKIQKVYGVAKDQADHQYNEFRKSVQSLLSSEATSDSSKSNQGKEASSVSMKSDPAVKPELTRATEPSTSKETQVG